MMGRQSQAGNNNSSKHSFKLIMCWRADIEYEAMFSQNGNTKSLY